MPIELDDNVRITREGSNLQSDVSYALQDVGQLNRIAGKKWVATFQPKGSPAIESEPQPNKKSAAEWIAMEVERHLDVLAEDSEKSDLFMLMTRNGMWSTDIQRLLKFVHAAGEQIGYYIFDRDKEPTYMIRDVRSLVCTFDHPNPDDERGTGLRWQKFVVRGAEFAGAIAEKFGADIESVDRVVIGANELSEGRFEALGVSMAP